MLYNLPGHDNRKFFSASEKPLFDFVSVSSSLVMDEKRQGLPTLHVWVRGHKGHAPEPIASQAIFYEFDTPKPSTKLLYLLAVLSANWMGMHCKQSQFENYGGYNLSVARMHSYLEEDISSEDLGEIQAFAADFIWQNRLGNFWRFAATAKDPSLARTQYLPEYPYEPYSLAPGYPTELMLKKFTVRPPSLEAIVDQSVLGMSFGKESLLTYAFFQRLGLQERLALGLITYVDNDKISYEKLQGYAEVYPALLERFEAEQKLTHPKAKVRTNFYQQFNKDVDWDVINYFQQIYTVLLAIASDRDYIILGDEYDCHIEDTLQMRREALDGKQLEGWTTASPVYTLDYHQSPIAHAKMNCLFTKLGLKHRIVSLITNIGEYQVQGLLGKLAPELLQYQVSCWFSSNKQLWCNDCSKCSRVALLRDAHGQPRPDGLLPYEQQGKQILGPAMFATDSTKNCKSPVNDLLNKISEFMVASHKQDPQSRRLPAELQLNKLLTDRDHYLTMPTDVQAFVLPALAELR